MLPSEYNKPVVPYREASSGRWFFYDPEHPLATQNGVVAYARHLVSLREDRWLDPGELVRFKDGNPDNHDLDNLALTTRKELIAITKGYLPHAILVCPQCGRPFDVTAGRVGIRRFCEKNCRILAGRRFEISAEDLHKLVWEMPTTDVADKFGVSDKAIEKRCKRLGVDKPPRGYWAKQDAREARRKIFP